MNIDKFKFVGLFVALSAILMSAGCEKPKAQAPESAAEETQPEGAADEPAAARRLVTIGFSVTEVVFALGAGEQVVATDKSSVYPEEAAKVATLDLYRKISAEPIIAQDPALVLASEETQPKEALEKIRTAGIEVLEFSEEASVEATKARIQKVGDALGLGEKADALNTLLDRQLAEAAQKKDACAKPARTLFVYARGPNTVMVGGEGTAVTTLIALAGGESVHGDIDDFKPMTSEAIVGANPDVILMTDGGLQSLGGLEGVKKMKGLGDTEAVKHGRVVTYDDAALLGFGPRLGAVALELADALCLDADVARADGEPDTPAER